MEHPTVVAYRELKETIYALFLQLESNINVRASDHINLSNQLAQQYHQQLADVENNLKEQFAVMERKVECNGIILRDLRDETTAGFVQRVFPAFFFCGLILLLIVLVLCLTAIYVFKA